MVFKNSFGEDSSMKKFQIGDTVEILPCPLAETFDIIGKIGKVIGGIPFSNIVVKIKSKDG